MAGWMASNLLTINQRRKWIKVTEGFWPVGVTITRHVERLKYACKQSKAIYSESQFFQVIPHARHYQIWYNSDISHEDNSGYNETKITVDYISMK